MCKLISNSKIKFALASLQVVLKQKHCFLWLLPLFLHLNKNKHNQTVIPTHLPYGLFAGFLTAVGEVSLFCSTSLLSALLQKRWTLTLLFRVTTSLYEFACICLFLWLPILLCSPLSDSKPGKKKKAISFLKSGTEIQLGEQPLCWRGCWTQSSEVPAIKTSVFVLVSAAVMLAGLDWLAFWMTHIWILVLQHTVAFTDVSAGYLLWRN